MKIFFKCTTFSGGAPLSMLEYAKLARTMGGTVIAGGEYSYNQDKYKAEGITLYNLPRYSKKKPIRNIKVFIKFLKVLKYEKPDIIVFFMPDDCVFGRIISELCDIPALYVYPGGVVEPSVAIFLRNQPVVVFSKENSYAMIKAGNDESMIDVITNRINVDYSVTSAREHYVCVRREIRMLMTSRINKKLINAVEAVMDVADKINTRFGNIHLDIAGYGDELERIREKAADINNRVGREIVTVLGYVENMKPLFNKSHIVFGKGRSVLEPVMLGRIGVVVGDDRNMCIINMKTIDSLSNFNFSGRGTTSQDSYSEIEAMVSMLMNGTINTQEVEQTSERIRDIYDVSRASERIYGIIQSRIKQSTSRKKLPIVFRIIRAIFQYIHFYMIHIKCSITQKITFSSK